LVPRRAAWVVTVDRQPEPLLDGNAGRLKDREHEEELRGCPGRIALGPLSLWERVRVA